MQDEPITLIASIAPIQTAIRLSGTGDGARIIIDVSEQFIEQVYQLRRLGPCNLLISLLPADSPNNEHVHYDKQLVKKNGSTKRQNQQSQWAPAEKEGTD